MEKKSDFGSLWLTVNRKCNFRCKWCYAEGTEFRPEDDLSFETAKNLIDLAADLKMRTVIITGGEPTYWDNLFQTIDYIHEKKLSSALVSNGYLFSKKDFFDKINESKLNKIVFSLKAANREQHREFTGTDTFKCVLEGIEKANKLENKNVVVTYVLSKLTIGSLKEVANVLASCGTRTLYLDMCSLVLDNGKMKKGYALEPSEYVKTIVDNIDEMSEIIGEKVYSSQSTMACIWPKETLNRLVTEGKVITGSCQMSSQHGIIFTSKAELIPCNHLYDYPLGKFGVDFYDANSFLEFRNSEPILEFFEKVKTYPTTDCVTCSENCIGGCPLQWIVFDPAIQMLGKPGPLGREIEQATKGFDLRTI